MIGVQNIYHKMVYFSKKKLGGVKYIYYLCSVFFHTKSILKFTNNTQTMKAITKLLFAVLVAMIGFSSCDKQEEVAPTIEIQGVAATENSIIFTINAKGATKCAYMLYDGTHFMEEEYICSMLIPAICKTLDIK